MQVFKRSVYCGLVDEKFLDKEITLVGWVNKRRDHGNLIFIDLRDNTGIMQLVFNPENFPQKTVDVAKKIRAEFVLQVKGVVLRRFTQAINNKIRTGHFELKVNELDILNSAKTLPYQLEEADKVIDDLRLKYRYLDLRRKKMFDLFKLRSEVAFFVREYFKSQNFLEIETPILSKSTPEGARDFLVPSRLQHNKFYALPQSPQIYKQLLMASGMDKYFQFAKCFRDEDFRSNRQPEFTQLDMEMSFVQETDVMGVVERLIKFVFEKIYKKPLKLSFPVYSYREIFQRFGSDKPDLRFGLEINDITRLFESTSLKFFKSVIEGGGRVGALYVQDKHFSRSELMNLENFAKSKLGANGLLYIKISNGQKIESPVLKFLPSNFVSALQKIIPHMQLPVTIFVVADQFKRAWEILGLLRLKLGRQLNLINECELNFSWVIDFPLLEWREEEKRWFAVHHPFTSPKEDIKENNLKNLKARAYDLVCNGEELGGGSIRIHNAELQSRIFEILGMNKKEVKEKFGFLLEAQELGFPPHGGFALGFDRLIMILGKTNSIRDVIAFPKMQSGICPMMQTPAGISKEQLKEIGIKLK